MVVAKKSKKPGIARTSAKRITTIAQLCQSYHRTHAKSVAHGAKAKKKTKPKKKKKTTKKTKPKKKKKTAKKKH